MTTRLLPPDEWPRLAGTLLENVWPELDGQHDRILVVEHDGSIVGCAALFTAWHLEGAWIAPEFRQRISVGRLLLRKVRALLKFVGAHDVMMMAMDPDARRICERIGTATHLDCEHFSVRV